MLRQPTRLSAVVVSPSSRVPSPPEGHRIISARERRISCWRNHPETTQLSALVIYIYTYTYIIFIYNIYIYICMATHISRVCINRVRLPILLLSPFALENLVSRDGFGSPVPRQPAHLHTQAESGAYIRDSSRVPRRRPFIYLNRRNTPLGQSL